MIAITALTPLAAHAGPFSIELNTGGTLYGNPPVNQANVPASNGAGGQNSCTPTSVANSLAYLTNAFPNVYGNSLLNDIRTNGGMANPQPNTTAGWTAIATELASTDYMSTDINNGTSGADWISGATNYIMNNAANTTTFANANNPSANFIFNQISSQEDLEVGILPIGNGIGHSMTVTSVMGIRNDMTGAITSMSIDGVDPAGGTFNLALGNIAGPGPMTLTYGGNAYNVALGVAQSPVPEPATVVLLASGLIGLFVAARRRRAA